MRSLTVRAALTVLLCTPATTVAQNTCIEFRAVSQQQLGLGWWGSTFATLGDEVLITPAAPPPPDATLPAGTAHGVVGMDYQGAKYLYDFGNGNSFVLELKSRAVYPHPPGKVGIGYYRATYNVSEGKGRFTGASGVIAESGPYVLWPDLNQPFGLSGRYNGELAGKICYGR